MKDRMPLKYYFDTILRMQIMCLSLFMTESSLSYAKKQREKTKIFLLRTKRRTW